MSRIYEVRNAGTCRRCGGRVSVRAEHDWVNIASFHDEYAGMYCRWVPGQWDLYVYCESCGKLRRPDDFEIDDAELDSLVRRHMPIC